jgi:hypothetical protein
MNLVGGSSELKRDLSQQQYSTKLIYYGVIHREWNRWRSRQAGRCLCRSTVFAHMWTRCAETAIPARDTDRTLLRHRGWTPTMRHFVSDRENPKVHRDEKNVATYRLWRCESVTIYATASRRRERYPVIFDIICFFHSTVFHLLISFYKSLEKMLIRCNGWRLCYYRYTV